MTDSSAGPRPGGVAVAVVVPALNAAATIGRTLAALAAQDLQRSYEVIVVDDGSDDETPAIVRDFAAEYQGPHGAFRLLQQERQGPGPARNRGMAESIGPVLAFTDADCFPHSSWLREGLARIEAGAEMVQGAVRPDPTVPLGPFDHTIWVVRESPLYETANLLVVRALFERLGGFEDWLGEVIGKPLAEDVWLGWRARRAGTVIEFCEAALVYHAVFARNARGQAMERVRLQYFPALARRIPELRAEFFYGRWFMTARSAAFDLALAGAIVALVSGSLWPLLAGAPYARLVVARALRWGRRAPRVAAGELLADAVGFVSLVWGSLRHRTPLL